MALSRPVLSARALLHRPAVLLTTTALALAALLGGGLLVANAVVGPDAVPVSASSSPSPAPEAAGATSGGADGDAAEPAGADPVTTSGGDDNVAVAVNTRDGSTVYAVRLKVVVTGADVVDAGNAAVAVASCADCQTVAIALEGVLVTGDAEVVSPENVALAINTGCTGCQTLAYAYQNLQTVDGKVRLTGAGRRTVARLRTELQALRRSGLDVLAVKQQVDRIALEFAAVLSDEVVPLAPATPGPPAPGQTADGAGAPLGAASAEPTADALAPSPTPSTEPSAGPQPSSTAGATDGATDGATAGATSEPTPEPTPTGG